MSKGRCWVASVAWLGARHLTAQRAILLVGMLLAVSRGNVAQGITLTPASEAQPWGVSDANIIVNGYHTVYLERYQSALSQEYLRIVGVSIDHTGPTRWSFASHGDRHNVVNSSGSVAIPQYFHQGPFGAGVAAPGETFYVAMTESNELYDPPWGYSYGYGWMQLQLAPPAANPNDPDRSGDLILLDSYFAYDKRGVVVGEHRVVPEPGTLALAGAAMIGAMRIWRSRARRGREANRGVM